jgi:hypothetical protein
LPSGLILAASGRVLALVLLSSAMVAPVAARNWDFNGNGNWSETTKWNPDGLPAPNEAVNIVFTDGTARNVTYDVPAPSLGLLSIDLTGPGATVSTLSLPNSNSLFANGIYVGGYSGAGVTSGRGALDQSDGMVATNPGWDLVVGHGAGSTGTYTLSGGALEANQSEFIGFSGTGTFNHTGGTNTINASAVGAFDLGGFAGAAGTYNLSGTAALSVNAHEYIGDSGTGIFNQTGGTNTLAAGKILLLGVNATGTGTYNLSGGTLAGDEIVVGSSGTGTLNILGNGTAYTNLLRINSASAVNLNGGTLRFGGVIGAGGVSKINYTSGTIQTSGQLIIGTDPTIAALFGTTIPAGKSLVIESDVGPNYNVTIRTNFVIDGGSLISANNLGMFTPPAGSAYSLTINDGLVYVENYFTAGPAPNAINLNGGTFRFSAYDPSGGGKFNFNAGTIQLSGNRIIGSDVAILDILGAEPTLTTGKGLTVEGTTTLVTSLILDGGTFSATQIVNASLLDLRRGTFNLTNQAVTIGSGGPLGSTLDVNEGMTVNVTLGITNQGLVTGDGQIGGTFANAAAGELRASSGRSLKFTGSGNTNGGQIILLGGELEFTQDLTNNAGAFISGNGSLITGGLTNHGTMNFAGTANLVGDVTNSATGKIISGGGGATIFYDDVTNDGEIRTSTNGFTVFFGSVSGAGTFTGTGTVNFEGDLSPGNSPAAVQFAGDVTFGADAALQIELGGTTPGTGHDQIIVAGDLVLDGALDVSLLPSLTPAVGQSFDILDWGSLSGVFSSLNLPALAGLAWNTSQLYTTGVLSLAAAGLPGDYNQNGTVDAADYVLWRDNVGTTSTLPNDPLGGTIGQAHYDQWRAHFGESASGGGAIANAAVPEPGCGALVVMMLCGLCRCRASLLRP